MREIKFNLIAKNMSGGILSEIFTLEELMDSAWEESFSVDIIAKRQFTSLKDKNGKEIYEGDIVKSWNLTNEFKEPTVCEVVWNRNFYATKRVDGGGSTGLHISDGDFGVEVIGNIYETPDLINQTGDGE